MTDQVEIDRFRYTFDEFKCDRDHICIAAFKEDIPVGVALFKICRSQSGNGKSLREDFFYTSETARAFEIMEDLYEFAKVEADYVQN